MCSGVSGCSTKTRVRESSAPMTSKLGFSVVAPIRVTVPSSAGGSRLSCWALLSRWISSMKRMVCGPPASSRSRASTDDLADPGHAFGDRAEGDEDPLRGAGDQVGERGLPAARRAPEDHRAGHPALDGLAQGFARPQQVLLPDKLVQRAPDACGRRGAAFRPP